jgi:hypothetical protein
MKTKLQYRNEITDALSLKQFESMMFKKNDEFFRDLRKVTKNSKLLALAEEGLKAPAIIRFRLISVTSNSFGDQIITIYDRVKHEEILITNQEGSWESPELAVSYLNKNSLTEGNE